MKKENKTGGINRGILASSYLYEKFACCFLLRCIFAIFIFCLIFFTLYTIFITLYCICVNLYLLISKTENYSFLHVNENDDFRFVFINHTKNTWDLKIRETRHSFCLCFSPRRENIIARLYVNNRTSCAMTGDNNRINSTHRVSIN